ncbi:MAG: baseplate J/gp47 family protein, partial [Chloroflexi bacterium]|nr:baseplate J/gp47 family protein [Chloroflexota bacterium]
RRTAQLQPWRKSPSVFLRQELGNKIKEPRETGSLFKEPALPGKKIPPWIRILLFAAGVFSVMAIAAILLPSARISFQEETSQKNLVIPIQARPGEKQVLISGIIPGRELILLVEGQLTLPSTGTIKFPSVYAAGEVVFTNLGEESNLIPKNTILSTDSDHPILFITQVSGNTPPGIGEQVTIPIEALEPGETGNIPENQILKINLSLGGELSVINPLPTSGGKDINISAPAEQDRRKLASAMATNLSTIAQTKLETQLSVGDVLLTTDFYDFEIVEEHYTPGESKPGDQLTLDKKVQYTIYYASADDLLSLAKELIQARYQNSDQELLVDSITLSQITSPEIGLNQSYSWDMKVSWEERRIINEQEIIQWVLGLKPDQAISLLQEKLALKYSPIINLTPTWWIRIPALPFRINISQGGR